MRKQILFYSFVLFFYTLEVKSQCSYNILNISHVDCEGESTGEISISIPNSNAIFWWQCPAGGTINSLTLSNLPAGSYILNIVEYFLPGDTNSPIICSVSDTMLIEQTIPITAIFSLSNNCNINDSADVSTIIYGGTPPYTTFWTHNGDTSRNISLPSSFTPYYLSVIDANGCQNDNILVVNQVSPMQTFMSVENISCKDDNSASARVFVENGTPPFRFLWSTGEDFWDENSSQINNLSPGLYSVEIQDTMGCVISDSIEINTDPKICLNIYKVFSPNEDGIHDYWEIENIHLYPQAVVEVYNHLGSMVYRRKNYQNNLEDAFNGFSERGERLASGTYYYVVDLNNGDDAFKGTISIVR